MQNVFTVLYLHFCSYMRIRSQCNQHDGNVNTNKSGEECRCLYTNKIDKYEQD
ncbi:hypothetical protein MITSMUL_05134 [Mitsuokella multacida DSM 20544]|uniref:Uncharacterized protein n=1 Tax=Mitsuokella multacida DSM 20544 TaxID=500635 RepID=C9KPH7_9FIRM|nr:hypothetical protein MITSMUL_05134 [Mitsuokella multacida DSM 20544]